MLEQKMLAHLKILGELALKQNEGDYYQQIRVALNSALNIFLIPTLGNKLQRDPQLDHYYTQIVEHIFQLALETGLALPVKQRILYLARSLCVGCDVYSIDSENLSVKKAIIQMELDSVSVDILIKLAADVQGTPQEGVLLLEAKSIQKKYLHEPFGIIKYANICWDLALYYCHVDFEQAAEQCRESLGHYKTLAAKNPTQQNKRYVEDVIKMLNNIQQALGAEQVFKQVKI